MSRGSSSESVESHGGWRWDGKAWWFKVGRQGMTNSRLRRKISTAVKATIEQDTTKRRDQWLQLKSKVEWLEAEKRQQQQKEQYRTWTLAGTQEPGPSFSGRVTMTQIGKSIHVRISSTVIQLLHPLCKRASGTATCGRVAGEWLAACRRTSGSTSVCTRFSEMTWLPVFEQSSATTHFCFFQQLGVGNELSCRAESVSQDLRFCVVVGGGVPAKDGVDNNGHDTLGHSRARKCH